MALIERVIQDLKDRRKNILEGNINSILSPFKRFRSDFIGIEQGHYTLITSSTKGGKTQFSSFLYIFTPLLYAYYHPDQIRLKILYFPLEETPEKVTLRFMSFLLNKLSKGKIRVSPSNLRSTNNEVVLDQKVIDVLETEEYQNILKFFEESVLFITGVENPTGIYRECVRYAKTVGTVHTKQVTYGKDEDAETHEVFDYYESNDPKLYNIVYLDHLGLIGCEKNYSLKQSMDKMSEYFAKYLRNRYNFTCIAIIQQAFEGEGLDAQRMGKMTPSIATLGDSKYGSRDANIVLGLFSPFKFELDTYKGYNIRKFRDNIRFLSVLVNRDGVMGGVCPLFFDGETSTFFELPLPDDIEGLNKVYSYMDTIRKKKSDKTFILFKRKKITNYMFNFINLKKWLTQ